MIVYSLLKDCYTPGALFLATRFRFKAQNPFFAACLVIFAAYRIGNSFYPPVQAWTQERLQERKRKHFLIGALVTTLAGIYFTPKSKYVGYILGAFAGFLFALKSTRQEPKK